MDVMRLIYDVSNRHTQSKLHVLDRATRASLPPKRPENYVRGTGNHQKLYRALPKQLLNLIAEKGGPPQMRELLSLLLYAKYVYRVNKEARRNADKVLVPAALPGLPRYFMDQGVHPRPAPRAIRNWQEYITAEAPDLRGGPFFADVWPPYINPQFAQNALDNDNPRAGLYARKGVTDERFMGLVLQHVDAAKKQLAGWLPGPAHANDRPRPTLHQRRANRKRMRTVALAARAVHVQRVQPLVRQRKQQRRQARREATDG